MLVPLALALLSAAPAPDTAWGAIRGTVQSEPSGLPLPLAVVEVKQDGRVYLATADSTGAYAFPRIPSGRQLFRVRHLEHEPMEIEVLVPARGQVVLDVSLRYRPLALDTLQARGAGELAADDSVAAPHSVSAITEFPAMEGGGVGAGLPGGPGGGGNGGGEPGEVLFVRGAAADLKLVLLDGAPVYAPFHMGGLIESFEPGLLSGARLYLGGAPARYDGGVSYVLDLSTRSANRARHTATGAVDMVSARGVLEGPVWGGATYLVAGRAVHGASLAPLEGEPFPYDFADALARVFVPLGRGVSLAFTGFRNREGVRIDTVAWRENFARWSTGAGSLRLRGPVLGSEGELTLALSDFDARLPGGAGTRVLLLEAYSRRARLAVDLARQLGDVRVAYGYAYDRQWVRHRAREYTAGERELLDTESSGMASGWYVDAHWRASRRWVVRGGVRTDMFSGGPMVAISPRVSATWLVSDRAALTLAAGRYHQYVRVRNHFPFDIGVPSMADSLGLATNLAVASANHVSLALDQELMEGVRLGLEGYYKRFQNIPHPEEVGTYASGVDVWVRRGTGVVTGWLGYSLAWHWARSDSAGDRFSGRQILSAGVGARMGPRTRASLRVAYGSGLPYTSLGGVGEPSTIPGGTLENTGGVDVPDGAPLAALAGEPFLRLDAELSRTWTPRVAARVTELTPYFRLINALDRRDALFYRYHPERADPHPIATLPVLPVVGVEWKF
ncbi:MAG TPA: carboxypeptidase-like regulatory domain-containing protein [Longimicrobiaceae bacterium]|nr:carboxypeptidase-like regulatory domain-containing protein [Longimicrobiaceae bacterium]